MDSNFLSVLFRAVFASSAREYSFSRPNQTGSPRTVVSIHGCGY
jgi:hypothetical protein